MSDAQADIASRLTDVHELLERASAWIDHKGGSAQDALLLTILERLTTIIEMQEQRQASGEGGHE